MRYLSLFSGVEAASLAWEPLGWKPVAFAQHDPEHDYSKGPDFPSAVLAHHWPHVPNLGDVTQITEKQIKALGRIDLVVFGSPCQDLSVAGKRGGLSGERSGLFRIAVQIVKWAVKHCECRFALWENVPGAISSQQGADFREVLSSLCGSKLMQPERWGGAGCCFGKTGLVEWATLDAQFFGVPQRRRRVFALADFGDWSDRQPVLSQREGMPWSSDPRQEKKEVASALTSKGVGVCGADDNQAQANHLIPFDMKAFGVYGNGKTASTCKARDYKDATDLIVDSNESSARSVYWAVRRLIPVECERLQGMPNNHTRVPWKGKPAAACPDSKRYEAIGNSMSVDTMRWLGAQIDREVQRICHRKL